MRQLRHGGLEVALTPWGRTSGENLFGYLPVQVFPAPLPAAQLIQATETDAAIQPGLQRAAVATDGGSRFHEFEEGLLDGVFAGGLVAENRVGKRVEPVGHQLVEISERIGRELTHPFEECVQLGVVGVTSNGAS